MGNLHPPPPDPFNNFFFSTNEENYTIFLPHDAGGKIRKGGLKGNFQRLCIFQPWLEPVRCLPLLY